MVSATFLDLDHPDNLGDRRSYPAFGKTDNAISTFGKTGLFGHDY